MQNMTTERKAAGNKVLPKVGLNGFDWAFEQGSTFVYVFRLMPARDSQQNLPLE